ncbi:uncharacterized protein [Ranitomeya imitator]|uniref:uncharacterized protein n=1 Tax=Ranitomeya imitator TaxID=111125 RepID=UPI0037E7BB91
MGYTRDRSLCHKTKPTTKKIRFNVPGRQSRHSRYPSDSLDISESIRFSSSDSSTNSNQEDKGGPGKYNPDCPILAKKTMVFPAQSHVHLGSVDPPGGSGSSFPGALQPPSCEGTKVDSLEFERQLLKVRGFSDSVINTLLTSRKRSTTDIYVRVWKKFLNLYPSALSSEIPVSTILEFLQKGRDLGLSVNTLKVQVSALGALYSHNVAGNRWIARFISACQRSEPVQIPQMPPWDINLVLEALTGHPFEPLDLAHIKYISLKTVLLVALVSARRVGDIQALSVDPPFMSIFPDRIVLKTDPSYLPKMCTKFHRSQEILLPSFYNNPTDQEEEKYHTLDVRRVIITYLDRTSAWRKSRALFVSFQGQRKGSGVTKGTLSRWIREAIYLAYSSKGENPPETVKAHSTRAIASSWAERAEVPIELICKAATWSSPSTFYSHYRLDLSASTDLCFGRSVLNTIIPPQITISESLSVGAVVAKRKHRITYR